MNIEISATIKAMPQYQEIVANIEKNFCTAIEARNELGAEGDRYVIQCGPMYCIIDKASKVTAVFAPYSATRYTDRAAASLVARRIRDAGSTRRSSSRPAGVTCVSP